MTDSAWGEIWFHKGRSYRATADTFSVPDFPPRWGVAEGDEVEGEPVQVIRRGTLVEGFVPAGQGNEPVDDDRMDVEAVPEAVYAFFRDCEAGVLYRYQLSLRLLWPWEEVE